VGRAGGLLASADPGLRVGLERSRVGYVLAVATSDRVTTGAGACQAPARSRAACPRLDLS
jgi:hypothetical protein